MSPKKKIKWNMVKSAVVRDIEIHGAVYEGFNGSWRKKEPCCDNDEKKEETKEHDTQSKVE